MSGLFRKRVLSAFKGVWRDRRGNVAILFIVSAVVLIGAVGAGIDLMRASVDQRKLAAVAALACQYATRPSVVATATANYAGVGSIGSFDSNVTSFVTTTLHNQFAPGSPAYNVTPSLSGTPGGSFAISLASSVPTTLSGILGYSTLAIGATANCTGSTAPAQVNNNNTLVQESFSSSLPAGTHYILPSGAALTVHDSGSPVITSPQSTFPSSPGFTGTSGTQWYIMGYCLEFENAGTVRSASSINWRAPVGGQNSGELDCDNGNHTAGNSSISTQVYLEAGNYELRYYYAGRVDYPNYDPAYICGSSAADVSWANDTQTGPYTTSSLPDTTSSTSSWAGSTVGSSSLRTNQINVYLDQPLANGTPPTHTTLDGNVTLAGSNLIDVCVYAPPNGNGAVDQSVWIQRSVRIYVTSPAYYWLSFAADGANDSYGGQLDGIALCQGTCTGSVQDNFPSPTYNPYYPGGSLSLASQWAWQEPDWLNPNGANAGLFTDTFATPAYNASSEDSNRDAVSAGNLNSSKGTTGSLSSGWPAAWQVGWYTVPINGVTYLLAGGEAGGQYIEVTGETGATSNRLTGRSMLLVPGYYNLSYYYQSDFVFNGVTTNAVCGATPAAAMASAGQTVSAFSGTASGKVRPETTPTTTQSYTVNALGVFMANAQLVSTPTSAGVAVWNASSYINPDSNLADTPPVTTKTSTATVAPDGISLTNYTQSTTSALLDFCGYSYSWALRSVNFEIQKTGIYWLMFSSQVAGSQSAGTGGAIDDVVVTALGSLGMTSPPSNPVVVPVGDPQPSAALYPSAGAGYYIISDPPTYPAALQ